MKNLIRTLIPSLILIAHFAGAQSTYTVTGTVADEHGEPLIAATVYLQESSYGTSTNFNGTFEIGGLTSGSYVLIASLIGYQTENIPMEITDHDLSYSIVLKEKAIDLEGVEVVAERIIERTTVSNISFGAQTLKTSQGLTEDPLRTLATLPGIGWQGDLFSPSQIYVRGGAPDENLFLMDNNQVYFPWYFGGQKSIFNTDAVENIELLTGGFSAAYGNHMSSVMNVKTRSGDFNRYRGNLSVGFYNASALFEGPVVKEKVSVLVAIRRTYLDLFMAESAAFPVVSLGDITYNLSYNVAENHKLTFSGLSSDESVDFLAANPEPGLPNKLETGGTNHFQSLQLRSTLGARVYNKLAVTNTLNENVGEIGSNLSLNIDSWQLGVRDDFTYYLSNKHKLRAGFNWQYGTYHFTGTFPRHPLQTDPNDTTYMLRAYNVHEKGEVIRGVYALYDGNPLDRVGINAGLRLDQNPGGGYTDVSPRIAINYQLTERGKARFSTGIYHQFPGAEGDDLKSSKAIHYILGYEHQVTHRLRGWVEVYYKDYQDLVYYDSALNYSNSGHGRARGVEFFLRRDAGNLRGWISYALSHSERTVPMVVGVRNFEFDQRHMLNLVTEYHIPREEHQWYIPALLQANFRYADGTPYTPVTGAVNDDSGWMQVQGEPLSARNTDYLNLNLRVEWKFIMGKKVRGTSFVEAWNLANHRNILGRSYQYGAEYPNNVHEQRYYATPFLMGGGFKVEFGG